MCKLLCSVGTRSVSVVTLWKETSVLCLFRPSFCPGAAWRCCLLSLHLSFWLLQISACFLSHSLSFETLFYLTDIFRRSRQRGLHFSTLLFTFQTELFRRISHFLLLSLFLSVFLVMEVTGSFSACLELFLKGDTQSGADSRTDSRDVPRLDFVFSLCHTNKCHS